MYVPAPGHRLIVSSMCLIGPTSGICIADVILLDGWDMCLGVRYTSFVGDPERGEEDTSGIIFFRLTLPSSYGCPWEGDNKESSSSLPNGKEKIRSLSCKLRANLFCLSLQQLPSTVILPRDNHPIPFPN